MAAGEIEIVDAVNEAKHQTLHAITKSGTHLPQPVAMPDRLSTISRMKDNLLFDTSEFFDIDAAAEPLSRVSETSGTPMPDGDSSLNGVLLSGVTDKFDPKVSFENYLRLSTLQDKARTSKSDPLTGKRGHLASAPKRKDTCVAPRICDESKYRTDPDVDVLRDAFKDGGKDGFLPFFSDPTHDAEFAAFAAAGRCVNREFRGVEQDCESHKQAAKATPSPYRFPGQEAPEMSPALQKDNDFTRAGLIYVAHILQQKPELSHTPQNTSHSYTREEIQWARSFLSDDVKLWMKRSCSVFGTKQPTLTGLDEMQKTTAPEPGLLLNHTAGSSSPMPQEQPTEAKAYPQNNYAVQDQMMSILDLDTELGTFEEANPPTQPISDDLQKSVAPKDAASALTVFSPASATSFITAEDDEMSMIPTFPTAGQDVDLNDALTPRALVSAFTCNKCNKVYKKKAYLLKHEAEANCKPKTPNNSRLAGVSTTKLSMTDQELIDNGLPSMEARNHRGMLYCTACNKEFSTVGRLRSHVLQFCPILRERKIYDKVQDQQPVPDETDLSVMEEINNGLEISPFRQPHAQFLMKSANLTLIPSMTPSENILGSQPDYSRSPTLKCGIAAIKGIKNSLQIDIEQSHNNEGLQLPIMRDSGSDGKKPGLKYPARIRLFSEELDHSPLDKSDPLEPFEDLPQTLKCIRPAKPDLVPTGAFRSLTRPAAAAQDIIGNPSSVTFSFGKEGDCAIATQTLEELITESTDPTIQTLRMWPSFSTVRSTEKATFEFKVTAPKSVDLVTTLRGLFPLMVTKVHGGRLTFVLGDTAALNSDSHLTLTPGAIEAPAAVVGKTKKSKKIDKQCIKQPQRSSRVSSGELKSSSHTRGKANIED
jgi:hypothetical protein